MWVGGEGDWGRRKRFYNLEHSGMLYVTVYICITFGIYNIKIFTKTNFPIIHSFKISTHTKDIWERHSFECSWVFLRLFPFWQPSLWTEVSTSFQTSVGKASWKGTGLSQRSCLPKEPKIFALLSTELLPMNVKGRSKWNSRPHFHIDKNTTSHWQLAVMGIFINYSASPAKHQLKNS